MGEGLRSTCTRVTTGRARGASTWPMVIPMVCGWSMRRPPKGESINNSRDLKESMAASTVMVAMMPTLAATATLRRGVMPTSSTPAQRLVAVVSRLCQVAVSGMPSDERSVPAASARPGMSITKSSSDPHAP